MPAKARICWGRLALAGAMVALAGAPAGAAAEGWLPFKYASPPKIEATETHVGVDKDGNVTAIWRNDPNITDAFGSLTIQSSVLGLGAANFAAPLPVNSTGGSGSPRVGVTENGKAIAVWERNNGEKDIVEGATRMLGTWGGTTELTDPGDQTADYPIMELAPNGEGIVGWRVEGSPRKNKVRLINGGNFAPAPGKAFDTSPYPGNNEPDVAVSSDGSRRFLAGHKYDLGNTRLNLYTYEGAGPWDAGVELANPTLVPQVAVAPNGEPVTAWMESNKLRIKRGGSETVTVADVGNLSLLDLVVGPNTEEFPNGMVLVTWRQFVDDGSHICCYQARGAVGTGFAMGAPIELSDELEDVINNPAVQAAIGPDGAAYAAWSRYDGDTWVPQASVRPPGGQFESVADDLAPGDATVGDLVVGADGRAIVAFDEIDSEGEELYWRAATAIYEPPPPPEKLPDGTTPPPPPAPPADTTPPKLKVNLSRKGFTPGDKLNQLAIERGELSYVWKRLRFDLKEGTRLLVSLDEPATLRIRVDKLGCFTGTPGNPTRNPTKQCDKPDPNVQHLQTSGKAGLSKIAYLGNWSGGKVKPGALYEFEVIAIDKAGNATRPKRAHFTLDGKPSANGF